VEVQAAIPLRPQWSRPVSSFAAVALIAANMPQALSSKCSPTRAIPFALVSGDADPLMPYNGGAVSGGISGNVLSIPETVAFWIVKSKLATAPRLSTLPDIDAADGTTTLYQYSTNTSVGEILLFSSLGGGHTWPGGAQYLPESVIGKIVKDFNENDAIVEFFFKAFVALSEPLKGAANDNW
jgi:polyhydroxybutyrate depolymerase